MEEEPYAAPAAYFSIIYDEFFQRERSSKQPMHNNAPGAYKLKEIGRPRQRETQRVPSNTTNRALAKRGRTAVGGDLELSKRNQGGYC